MPSPLHGLRPPYTLPSNVVYFHDWRYIDHGGFAWRTEEGNAVPLFTLDPVPPMRLDYRDMPLGVRLVAQKATKSEPVLTPETANAIFLFGGSLIHDEGRYRLWYECWPEEGIGTPHMGTRNFVRYAESDDGVDWKLPNVGIIEYHGSTRNNIVYGAMLVPETGYHGGCVFKDPSAPPEERYKGFNLAPMSDRMWEEYRRKRPHEIDPFLRTPHGLFGSVSPDGLRWAPIHEPLVAQNSDTHNICTYDVATGKYVAYCRSWFFNRRTIGRMETDDFHQFPLPEELFWPNAMMDPHDLWYANAKTMMPGTTDYHVMFPMRWSLVTDSFSFHLATSPDGIVWGFVPDAEGRNAPVCVPGPPGSWDEGVVAPGLGLVDLPGNRIGILYSGSPVPHKHPRRPPLGKLAWAWWPKDRLVALEAPVEGSCALQPLLFKGRAARLNFRTRFTGYVQVEACGLDGKVLPGRSFAECDRINGDELDRVVTWKGQSDLGHADGQPVRLRFRMRSAELFAVRFA